ncbi:MAG TPA: hypothetical protein VJV79_12455 [Polyangiaceae bacterium]|nr:hypothetical protein [Polyangiaceae bacterium]
MSDLAKHERELCFEILFASLAAGGDSREVLAHATDIELGRELEQECWASIRSWSRVSVMLRIFIASSSSALARHRAGVSEVEQHGSIHDLGHDA